MCRELCCLLWKGPKYLKTCKWKYCTDIFLAGDWMVTGSFLASPWKVTNRKVLNDSRKRRCDSVCLFVPLKILN